jgi:hypothetical protein
MIYEETTSPNQNGPNVKTIQVPDPPMCHSTGVSGTDSDLDCTATLSQLNANDIRIEVYNHVRQAMAFEQNPAVPERLLPPSHTEARAGNCGGHPGGASLEDDGRLVR